jgi:hypothetical protein
VSFKINDDDIKSWIELVHLFYGTANVEIPETAYKKVKPRSQK